MADEISLSQAISVFKSSVMSSAIGRSMADDFDMTGLLYIGPTVMVVATSATLIPLGQVTAPHWTWLKNLDATNFIKIRNGATGADLIKLLPGEATVVPLYDSAVPYAIADTASAKLEYAVWML